MKSSDCHAIQTYDSARLARNEALTQERSGE
jgi:hypothetical protein